MRKINLDKISSEMQLEKLETGLFQYSIMEHPQFMILNCRFELNLPGRFKLKYLNEKLLAVFTLKGSFTFTTSGTKNLLAQGCGQVIYSRAGCIEYLLRKKQTYSFIFIYFSHQSIEQLSKVYLPVQQLFEAIVRRKDASLFIYPRIIPDGVIFAFFGIGRTVNSIQDMNLFGHSLLLYLRSELYEANKEYLENILTMDESHDEEQFYKAIWIILQNPAARRTIKNLAQSINVNEFRLKKVFKMKFKLSVSEFQENIRIEKAKALLEEGKSIQDIANLLGYSSLSHFSSVFKRKTGFRPTTFRRENVRGVDKIIAMRPV